MGFQRRYFQSGSFAMIIICKQALSRMSTYHDMNLAIKLAIDTKLYQNYVNWVKITTAFKKTTMGIIK